VTVTVVEREAVPPAPVQLRTNVVVCDSAAVTCEPDKALLPDQPPEALHEVALADDQLSIAVPPCETWLGVAAIVIVGGGGNALTVTVVVLLVVPPAPLQLSE
jgi:hypothetical protein